MKLHIPGIWSHAEIPQEEAGVGTEAGLGAYGGAVAAGCVGLGSNQRWVWNSPELSSGQRAGWSRLSLLCSPSAQSQLGNPGWCLGWLSHPALRELGWAGRTDGGATG